MPSAILSLALLLAAPGVSAEDASEPATDAEPEATVTAEAPEEPEDPDQLAKRAEQAFADGRFDEVVDLAARAYALTGDPRHLYAQALAERRLGRCREALILYARVLASVEDDPTYAALVDGTRQGIKLCEASLEESESAKEAVAKPEPEPEPTEEPGTPAEAGSSNEASDGRVADGPRPWFRDPLGGVLLGVGLAVGGGAGGTLWALSNRELQAAERAMDETVYADTRAQARGLRTGAVASLTVGGSLVIGAVVRYVLVRRAGRRSGTTAGRRGTVVRVRGRLGPRSGSLLVGW